nr:histamine N-methyltransferase A-like [Lytechinus pictus]
MENVKSIRCDPDHYTKAFKIVTDKCNMYEFLGNWVQSEFPSLVLDKLAGSFSAETPINMLGVGSGSGETDSKLAASIKTRFRSVRNVVVEPAEKMLDIYRALIDGNKSDFEGIEFDLRQLGIDEFRAQEGDHPAKYHFISTIQSLYYAADFEDTIRYLYDCLEEGGIMLIIIVSDTCGSWRLWNRVPLIMQTSTGSFFCASDVRQCLSSQGIHFEENHQGFNLDITSCFEEGSEEGALLLDFITEIIDFRGSVSPDFLKEVMEYMGSDQCSERKEDGTIFFNKNWDALVVQKPLVAKSN